MKKILPFLLFFPSIVLSQDIDSASIFIFNGKVKDHLKFDYKSNEFVKDTNNYIDTITYDIITYDPKTGTLSMRSRYCSMPLAYEDFHDTISLSNEEIDELIEIKSIVFFDRNHKRKKIKCGNFIELIYENGYVDSVYVFAITKLCFIVSKFIITEDKFKLTEKAKKVSYNKIEKIKSNESENYFKVEEWSIKN